MGGGAQVEAWPWRQAPLVPGGEAECVGLVPGMLSGSP